MDIIKDMVRSNQIAERRKKRGWTQQQLAEVSGVDVRTIQRIENGRAVMLSTLQALASAFDCSVEDILNKTPSARSEKATSDVEKNARQQKPKEPKIHFLRRIRTGKEVFNVCAAAHLFESDTDNPETHEEADALAAFIQNVKDAGEMWNEIEPGERVQTAFDCNDWIKKVEELGFSVFGLRRNVIWISNLDPNMRTPMETATIVVKRSNDPRIVKGPDGSEILPTMISNGSPV